MSRNVELPAPELVKLGEKDRWVSLLMKNVRIAFARLDAPGKAMEGNEKRFFEATLLIPKKSGIDKQLFDVAKGLIKTAPVFSGEKKKIGKKEALSEKEKIFKTVTETGEPKSLLKDGDVGNSEGRVYEGCEGHYTLKVKQEAVQRTDGTWIPKNPLRFERANKSPIREHEIGDELYSGAWCDVAFTMYAYAVPGSKGLTNYLGGMMKLVDDTRLGGSDPFAARDDIPEPVPASSDAELFDDEEGF